jgi:hypothetical protein
MNRLEGASAAARPRLFSLKPMSPAAEGVTDLQQAAQNQAGLSETFAAHPILPPREPIHPLKGWLDF